MDEAAEDTSYEQPPNTGISWTASEFMDHQKGGSWYVLCLGAIVVIAGLLYGVTRDIFSSLSAIVLGVLLAVVASRKPRTMEYRVDEFGVSVGARAYSYDEFASFSIIREGSIESFMLLPAKRWMTPITMFFAPSDGDQIFGILSQYLPFEDRDRDGVDKFLHKIRL
jgi:hypothetical protein